MRFRVPSRDVPKEQAAKRMGLSLPKFSEVELRLQARGFPQPDKDTNLYDLEAIDRWCDARNPHLFAETATIGARSADDVVMDRIKKMSAKIG